ncbi:hypothetical protein [Pseudomonas sp. TH41]|uniref:hypothetical protein n=1 Tax=Pseudomonas sp. TH41 TaxID=2796405 RepID=UPI001F5B894E|nr:hypothetical protein [Pseudomonas sp. TH41]
MTGPALADVRDIRALFEPDASKPQKNEFVNQTPSEGFCSQVPGICKPAGLFSLLARIPFTANAPILANHADPRKGGMAQVPSEWRDVTVTLASGDSTVVETKVVQVRIAGIGHEASIPVSIGELTGGGWWDQLWAGGSWVYAPSPCEGVGVATAGHHGYNSFWKVPVGAGVCSKKALFDIPFFSYQYIVFGYEMRTPDPLNMQSGEYTGTISYTVGPGMDFDMGDVMIPSNGDSQLTLNFLLEVRHTLKVDIPPGGNRVELVPQGGWQAWLTQGRKPTRLFRDQTFNISASGRFKMNLQCQYYSGNTCALWEPTAGHPVPLNVSVTLPNGLTDGAGKPVSRQPLLSDGTGTELFQPGLYVDRKPGTLHFEIARDEVAEMLHPGRARSYSGNVTVIWDSEVG